MRPNQKGYAVQPERFLRHDRFVDLCRIISQIYLVPVNCKPPRCLCRQSSYERLIHAALEQVENPALTAPVVTRTLIASHLATTPETVSRALRSLEETASIQFDHHRII